MSAMNRIDESKPFKPVNIAVLTVSDTRTLETDKSGDTLVERIARDGHVLADRAIVTDDVALIRAQVKKWIDDPEVDAVITTGGTGVTGRDVTPEALEGLFEKKIDGFGEIFRWISFQKIGTSTMQSPRHRGRGQRHLYLRPARLDRRLQGRLGRHPAPAARHPLPALQLRRADAAAERRQDAAQERLRALSDLNSARRAARAAGASPRLTAADLKPLPATGTAHGHVRLPNDLLARVAYAYEGDPRQPAPRDAGRSLPPSRPAAARRACTTS